MLSISEICDKAGISLHNFQSWRRDGLTLLPKPVAVDKKVIYFDDSILERIRIIKEQKAAGLKLREIAGIFKSCDALAAHCSEPDRKITVLADILAQLAVHELSLQKLMDEHKQRTQELLAGHERQIQDLFQHFQALMTGTGGALPDGGEL